MPPQTPTDPYRPFQTTTGPYRPPQTPRTITGHQRPPRPLQIPRHHHRPPHTPSYHHRHPQTPSHHYRPPQTNTRLMSSLSAQLMRDEANISGGTITPLHQAGAARLSPSRAQSIGHHLRTLVNDILGIARWRENGSSTYGPEPRSWHRSILESGRATVACTG